MSAHRRGVEAGALGQVASTDRTEREQLREQGDRRAVAGPFRRVAPGEHDDVAKGEGEVLEVRWPR
ncbi:MAG TPA: hypothetical protein VMW94_11170 [Actinomycetes bacterium]|nr:hypothetical protein [Actinomycetes bacterium]